MLQSLRVFSICKDSPCLTDCGRGTVGGPLSLWLRRALFTAFVLAPLFSGALAAGKPSPDAVPWTIDFRYAPPDWQTSICLPDDWQKTLVGKDGSLLYDYPGKHAGFGTRITASLAGGAAWVRQELASPRVPIVRTTKRAGTVELVEEAFAVAPPLAPAKKGKSRGLILERVGPQTGQANWASPPKSADPAFRNAAIGWAQPVQYRFKAPNRERDTVVFGLCEGHHQQPGQRILDLQIEGKTVRTVDLVAEKGRNVPQLFSCEAQDDNGDGWIDLAVATAEKSPDANTILNVLWVFRAQDKPSLAELLSGQSTQPALAHLDCGADHTAGKTSRQDLLFAHLRNDGAAQAKVSSILTIESEYLITPQPDRRRVLIGSGTALVFSRTIERWEQSESRLILHFVETSIAPGGQEDFVVGVARGANASDWSTDAVQAAALRKRAEQFWQKLDLPYGHLQVPDSGVQALLDSCVRNIYQAREIKKDLPAFQVGPTCYRGLWVVDGSFIMEAVAYLGRAAEARNGIKYLLSFQREDGGVMLIDGHWKETGIALWAVTRHARLTDDKAWLREVWPKVERGFAYIHRMRAMASADAKAPNAGLVPDGFSDGGLADKVPEYTNIYWTMAGMRAAVEAARWLGRPQQADDWQKEYDDFCQTFRRAAERDTRTDARGNRYLPIRMRDDGKIPPQKAQWAFLHAVFPGKVFAANDPLVQGNMAMLRSVEAQGLVLDTGWLKDGIWNYFASFYGHAWLWLGGGAKAAETLYAFGNHASPLLVWREEQMPVGQGGQVVGDMPHNWASAEFIRLVRHSLMLERGGELHLFEAFPPAWAKPGAVTKVKDILTEFGPVSLEFRVSADGTTGQLRLSPPARTRPERIVLHLEPWSRRAGTMDLPVKGKIEERIRLNATATLPDP